MPADYCAQCQSGKIGEDSEKIHKIKKGSKIHSFYQSLKVLELFSIVKRGLSGSIEGGKLCTNIHCPFPFPDGSLGVTGMWLGEPAPPSIQEWLSHAQASQDSSSLPHTLPYTEWCRGGFKTQFKPVRHEV